MSCEECRRRLLRFLHGELREGADRVGRHLRDCPDCRREEEAERTLWAAMGEVGAGRSGADLVPALDAALDRPRIRRRWLAAAAAAALVAFLALRETQDSSPLGSGRPQTHGISPFGSAFATEDDLLDRHSRMPESPLRRYPYVDGYDRAVYASSYISFILQDAPQGEAIPLPRLPAFALVPRAPVPDAVLTGAKVHENGVVQLTFTTARGSFSIFQEPSTERGGARQTVVREGREFKVIATSVGGVRCSIVSECIPWPEMRMVEESLARQFEKGD